MKTSEFIERYFPGIELFPFQRKLLDELKPTARVYDTWKTNIRLLAMGLIAQRGPIKQRTNPTAYRFRVPVPKCRYLICDDQIYITPEPVYDPELVELLEDGRRWSGPNGEQEIENDLGSGYIKYAL